MADKSEPAELIARIAAIIEDEQRLERFQKNRNARYNELEPRAFAFKRIAQLIFPDTRMN